MASLHTLTLSSRNSFTVYFMLIRDISGIDTIIGDLVQVVYKLVYSRGCVFTFVYTDTYMYCLLYEYILLN